MDHHMSYDCGRDFVLWITTCPMTVVEVKFSGSPYVLGLWLGLGKGILLVKHLTPTIPILCDS